MTRGSSKVTRNGQITIPKAIRDRCNVQEGDTVVFEVQDGRVLLRFVDPVPMSREDAEAIRRGIQQLLEGEAVEYADGMYTDSGAEGVDRRGR